MILGQVTDRKSFLDSMDDFPDDLAHFDDAFPDGRYVLPGDPNNMIRAREAYELSLRLGRPLTDEEMEQFKVKPDDAQKCEKADEKCTDGIEYDAQKIMDAIAKQEHKLGVVEGEAKGRTKHIAMLKLLRQKMQSEGTDMSEYIDATTDEAILKELCRKYNIS